MKVRAAFILKSMDRKCGEIFVRIKNKITRDIAEEITQIDANKIEPEAADKLFFGIVQRGVEDVVESVDRFCNGEECQDEPRYSEVDESNSLQQPNQTVHRRSLSGGSLNSNDTAVYLSGGESDGESHDEDSFEYLYDDQEEDSQELDSLYSHDGDVLGFLHSKKWEESLKSDGLV